MKILNEIKLNFKSVSENERVARMVIAGVMAELDPMVDELIDVKTAVSEAVTNAIVHGYRGTVGKISMVIRILENRVIYIKIRDYGVGIENITQAKTPLFTTAPEEERAGLGFAVMESFMDKMTVKSTVSKGTTVILTKKISSRENKNG